MCVQSKIANQKSKIFKNGVVLTIGTFDGVHTGHRTIIKKTVDLAQKRKIPSLAVTFHKPPRSYLFKTKASYLLTQLPEKKELLTSYGIQHIDSLTFNHALARLSAQEFFKTYCLHKYNVKEIVVGYNFGFGRSREGDTTFLRTQGEKYGVPVHIIQPVCLQGIPNSSGQIRQHLLKGELAKANQKLGYHYFLTGKVIKGKGLGKKIGYPTANIKISREKIVPPGVYAVTITLPSKKTYSAMCNIGTNPTIPKHSNGSVCPSYPLQIEAHLFHFAGHLLGKTLRMEFIKKIRSEKKFPSLKALTQQLKKDEKTAKKLATAL